MARPKGSPILPRLRGTARVSCPGLTGRRATAPSGCTRFRWERCWRRRRWHARLRDAFPRRAAVRFHHARSPARRRPRRSCAGWWTASSTRLSTIAFAVRRVLRILRPRVVIVLETEIWPNLYREAKRNGCALLVVNGRISDRAMPRYRRFRWFFRAGARAAGCDSGAGPREPGDDTWSWARPPPRCRPPET